jgi:hypothetical protein
MQTNQQLSSNKKRKYCILFWFTPENLFDQHGPGDEHSFGAIYFILYTNIGS